MHDNPITLDSCNWEDLLLLRLLKGFKTDFHLKLSYFLYKMLVLDLQGLFLGVQTRNRFCRQFN